MAKCSGAYLVVAGILATAGPQTPAHLREMTRNMRTPGAIPMPNPGRVRLTGQGFDIEAKVPEGTPRQQVNEMLQALREERFARKVHPESRSVP